MIARWNLNCCILQLHWWIAISFVISIGISFLTTTNVVSAIKIGLVPKPQSTENKFFHVVNEGCKTKSRELSKISTSEAVECIYRGADAADAQEQASIMLQMVEQKEVDGIAVSVSDVEVMTSTINSIIESTNGTFPVITYDSDADQSKRMAFIATNNFAFGEELGKVLDQLDPYGGKYGMIGTPAPNVMDRVYGIRSRLNTTKWTEISNMESPADCQDNLTLSIQQMYEFAANPEIRAILPVGGWPMYLPDEWKEFVEAYPNLTIVCGDSLDIQLELMNQGYVNGLVGQLPFQMGQQAAETIYQLLNGEDLNDIIYGTAMLEVLRFPLNLPDLTVNKNQIGMLAIMGYIYVPIILLSSIGFAIWIVWYKKQRVVAASQPIFLLMICTGVFIMGAGIVPLSMDDEHYSQESANIACMSTWWLEFIGFSLVFSALFSKTWRINRLFHNAHKIRRIKVEVKDVIVPLVCIMAINGIILICWTTISPSVYVREDLPGTDDWNRVIASYGTCRSDSQVFVILLLVVNLFVLLIANIQAYQARSIETEFSESRYISIIMASILQSAVLGIPIAVLSNQSPRTQYTVVASLIFITCIVTLGFIFVPKVLHLREVLKKGPQRGRVTVAIGGSRMDGVSMVNNDSHFENRDDTHGTHVEQNRMASDQGLKIKNLYYKSGVASENSNVDRSRPNMERQYLTPKQQQIISLLQWDLDINLDKFVLDDEDESAPATGEGAAATSLSAKMNLVALKKKLLGKLQENINNNVKTKEIDTSDNGKSNDADISHSSKNSADLWSSQNHRQSVTGASELLNMPT